RRCRNGGRWRRLLRACGSCSRWNLRLCGGISGAEIRVCSSTLTKHDNTSNALTLQNAGLLSAQLTKQGPQQGAAALLRLAAAGEVLGDLQKHLHGSVAGRNLGDHLAVVGECAENLRFKRNR